MTSAAELQDQYIAELRALAPSLEAWWAQTNAGPDGDYARYRWPTGPAGHPKVLAIFRKYFLLIEEQNLENRSEPDRRWPVEEEDFWGRDDMGTATEIEKPADWLINDIPAVAPDIQHLTQGIVYVPIGLDDDEAYC